MSKKSSIGTTIDGNHIYAYQLSKQTGVDQSARPVNLFVVTMLYARDVTSLATLVYFVERLSRDFVNNVDAALWQSGAVLHVIPVVNIDSFESDHNLYRHGGGETVRNTRGALKHLTPEQHGDVECTGVNLDRNFPQFWGASVTSREHCKVDYCGTRASSEPETTALIKYVGKYQPQFALVLHSLSGLHEDSQLLYPWFYRNGTTAPPLANDELQRHLDVARRMNDSARRDANDAPPATFLVAAGSASLFAGDGTMADYLYEYELSFFSTGDVVAVRNALCCFLLLLFYL